MVLSSGFWTILIAILILALLFYFRERRLDGLGLVKNMRLGERILAWLREFWSRLHGQVRSLQDTLLLLRESESLDKEAQAGRPRWRFLRVSNLSPRDQLRYFYLSTIRRAGDKGVKREAADTPIEYVEDLKQSWPEAKDGLDNLTQSFLMARYSDKEISVEDIPPVKGTWKEVRRELNQKPTSTEDHDPNEEG
jgi:hypothetical protein